MPRGWPALGLLVALPAAALAVTGRVVDQAGRPVAGARVLTDTTAEREPVTTAADGTFAIAGAPEQPARIIALRGRRGYGEATWAPGRPAPTVTIVEAPEPDWSAPPAPSDRALAWSLVRTATDPAQLAPALAELVLTEADLAASAELRDLLPKLPDTTLADLAAEVAPRDPVKADALLRWLEQAGRPVTRVTVWLQLANDLPDDRRDEAERWYRRALAQPVPSPPRTVWMPPAAALAAGAAERFGRPAEADAWLDRVPAEYTEQGQVTVAETLGPYPRLVERWLARFQPGERPELSPRALAARARRDPAGAYAQLLASWPTGPVGAAPVSDRGLAHGEAAAAMAGLAITLALPPPRRADALVLARRLPGRVGAQALRLLARAAPTRQEAAELLDASAHLDPQGGMPAARDALVLAPELAPRLFTEALARYRLDHGPHATYGHGGRLAWEQAWFYLTYHDPNEARRQAERVARLARMGNPAGGENGWNDDLAALLDLPIDVHRYLGHYRGQGAPPALAIRWLVSSGHERALLDPFGFDAWH